ncbi:unnamed protein product [Prunus armeniaca]|uniref:Uncharacterized protein n=1 Tax=Prunus armeniaca TaxID=36596 RepID=A0A6J5U3C2_PRUAR|nr:unnamed protein product [Prunus armeniaca]
MDVRDQYKNGGKVSVEDGATWERERGRGSPEFAQKMPPFLHYNFNVVQFLADVAGEVIGKALLPMPAGGRNDQFVLGLTS